MPQSGMSQLLNSSVTMTTDEKRWSPSTAPFCRFHLLPRPRLRHRWRPRSTGCATSSAQPGVHAKIGRLGIQRTPLEPPFRAKSLMHKDFELTWDRLRRRSGGWGGIEKSSASHASTCSHQFVQLGGTRWGTPNWSSESRNLQLRTIDKSAPRGALCCHCALLRSTCIQDAPIRVQRVVTSAFGPKADVFRLGSGGNGVCQTLAVERLRARPPAARCPIRCRAPAVPPAAAARRHRNRP